MMTRTCDDRRGQQEADDGNEADHSVPSFVNPLTMMMMLNVFSTSRRLPAVVGCGLFFGSASTFIHSATHTDTHNIHTLRRHVWPVPAALFRRRLFSASNLRFRSLPPIVNRAKERGHTSDLFVCSNPHCWITSCCSIEKHLGQMMRKVFYNLFQTFQLKFHSFYHNLVVY